MISEEIPGDIVAFVVRAITSIEQINILILLRERPDRKWTAATLSAELRSTESAIQRRLDDLYAAGVLQPPAHAHTGIGYSPTAPAVGEMLDRLIELYRNKPTRLIELVYSRPAQGVLAFADAFRLTKEKP